MNSSLVQLIAPMGCYSARDGIAAVQRESQGYIKSTTAPSVRSYDALRARVSKSPRVTPELSAAAEMHVISHPHAPEVRAHRAYSQRQAARMMLAILIEEILHA